MLKTIILLFLINCIFAGFGVLMMLSQRLCFCCVCSIFAVYFLNNVLSVKVLSNWQRFRDEQLLLLNWLSDEEKTLKDMGRTDLTNEEEVKQDLEKLHVRT